MTNAATAQNVEATLTEAMNTARSLLFAKMPMALVEVDMESEREGYVVASSLNNQDGYTCALLLADDGRWVITNPDYWANE